MYAHRSPPNLPNHSVEVTWDHHTPTQRKKPTHNSSHDTQQSPLSNRLTFACAQNVTPSVSPLASDGFQLYLDMPITGLFRPPVGARRGDYVQLFPLDVVPPR